jgi:uncharacterized membrane protein HdeD (DUF308 family)
VSEQEVITSGLLDGIKKNTHLAVVTCIFELVSAFQIRPTEGWGVMLFNGIVTLLLGIMIWRQFPLSGAWAVGILFGVKLMLSGWSLIFIGRSVRGAAKAVAA